MNSALLIFCMVAVVPTTVQSLSKADLLPFGDETDGDVKIVKDKAGIKLNHSEFKYVGTSFNEVDITTFGSIMFTRSTAIWVYFFQIHRVNNKGVVWYRETTKSTDRNQLTSQIRGASNLFKDYTAAWAFIVTWDEMGVHGVSGNITFQAALVTDADGDETFVVFNYLKLHGDAIVSFYNNDEPIYHLLEYGKYVDKWGNTSNTGIPKRWIFNVSTGIQSGREINNYNCSNSCPQLLECKDKECKCTVTPSNTCPTTTLAPTTTPPTTTPPTTTTQVPTSPPNTTLLPVNTSASILEPTTTKMDTCTNIIDGKCEECKPGWKGDECRQRDCTHQKYCTKHTCNEHGEDYNCTCNKGYKNITPRECVDIDECDVDRTLCGEHFCNNTEGSFHCTCNDGYENIAPDFCAEKMSPSADPDNFDQNKVQSFDSIEVKAIAATLSLSVIAFLVINMIWCAKTIILAILRFVLTERTGSYESDMYVLGTDSSEDEQEQLEAMGDDVIRTLKTAHLKSGTFRKSLFQRAKSVFTRASVDEDMDDQRADTDD